MIAPGQVFCPKCGTATASHVPTYDGFVEVGDYDGKSYELEYDVKGYRCSTCRMTFYTGDLCS